jgi:ABC-type cobalamin transport system ATPase subunit
MLHDDTATSSLGRVLGVGQCQSDDLYRALDWLHGVEWRIKLPTGVLNIKPVLPDSEFVSRSSPSQQGSVLPQSMVMEPQPRGVS